MMSSNLGALLLVLWTFIVTDTEICHIQTHRTISRLWQQDQNVNQDQKNAT